MKQQLMTSQRLKLSLCLLVMLVISFFLILPQKALSQSKWDEARLLVTMRKIGDQILLQSGDSTTRILPVEKTSDNSFEIKFESQVAFDPAMLVDIIHSNFEKDRLPLKYLVEVVDRKREDVFYSYEVKDSPLTSTIPCLTRKPAQAHYSIKIHFEDPPVKTSSINKYVSIIGLPFLAILIVIGLISTKKTNSLKPRQTEELSKGQNTIQLASFCFDPDTLILLQDDQRIELSSKESKLLKIFAEGQNQAIERDRLMKEVWEDEGVIVGRSLDVFVSKLRKKLQADPLIKLVNIHGKGYKLEVRKAV